MNENPPKSANIHCPHFIMCSGCSLDEAVDHPPLLKEAFAWFNEKGIHNFTLHRGSPVGWRMRAKLAVRGSSENPQIGLYEEGTHNVVDIPLCRVHHPILNLGVERVRALIKQHGITLYNETSGQGELRYLQLILERSSSRLHLSFVLNFSPDSPAVQRWKNLLKELWENPGPLVWHSFSVNYNTRRDNVILTPQWELWCGEPNLWEIFLGTSVCFHPSSFAQANLDQFEELLKTVHRWTPPQATLAEYYAGVGVIGLTLAEKSKEVLCCEINPAAQQCFETARAKLSSDQAAKITWHQGKSQKFDGWLDKANVIIIDPPRKGIEQAFLNCLKGVKSGARLIYVSCGWPSFKRDAEALINAGWQLKEAEGHLFFPGSNHIETAALLQKT